MTNSTDVNRISGWDGRRSPRAARLLAKVGLGMLAGLVLAASGAAAQSSERPDLEQAVVDEMLGQREGQTFGYTVQEEKDQAQVNVERVSKDENWAFGTSVIVAPKKKGAYPEGWLFVAEKTGEGWNVVLEGEEGFAELAEKAPTAVVEEEEKEMFAAASDPEFQAVTRTKLRLPWRRGARWPMNGGPHGWATGYDRPYSALDLGKSGGKVRAARGGRVYTMCANERGWIRVYHRNGYATDYYHLRGNIKPRDGKRIKSGTFLGYTGTDTSCGGAAYGDHVHFALLRNRDPVSLDGKVIGGWLFREGAAYKGYARYGDTRRFSGDYLKNFGPS